MKKCEYETLLLIKDQLTAERLLTEDAYNIFRQCMYKPTYEDYRNRVTYYIGDKNAGVFTCTIENEIVGIIILMRTGDECAELVGVAVHSSFQKQGVGGLLIRESASKMHLHRIIAETDDDAVGFYIKQGFEISQEIKYYADKRAVRYHCTLAL